MTVNLPSKGFSRSRMLAWSIFPCRTGQVSWRYRTFSSSSSTALKSTPSSSKRYFVSAPAPGPTSNSRLNAFSRRVDTILREIFSSRRKCWPRDFFRVYMDCKFKDLQSRDAGDLAFAANKSYIYPENQAHEPPTTKTCYRYFRR